MNLKTIAVLLGHNKSGDILLHITSSVAVISELNTVASMIYRPVHNDFEKQMYSSWTIAIELKTLIQMLVCFEVL